MRKSRLFFLLFIVLVAVYVVRIIDEFETHATSEENEEYVAYVDAFKKDLQSKWQNLEQQVGQSLSINYNPDKGSSLSTCITSNFEGAEVTVEGFELHQTVFKRDTAGIDFDCNRATFDPDHPYYGLPDLNVSISPVNYFQPKSSSLKNFMQWMGEAGDNSKPYRIYEKKLIVTDSSGEIKIRSFAMQLWLTSFHVTVQSKATRQDPVAATPETELDAKIYPPRWYGRLGTRKLSMNDLDNKNETRNLYDDISIVLKVNPNASPWYIKTDNMQTARPKIAVGGVFCQHFEKRSLNKSQVDFNVFAGKASPLYFYPFEKDEELLSTTCIEQTADFIENINELNHLDIWDRPYYLRLKSKNIGSRHLVVAKDDYVDMEFLMPLLVIGSLDVVPPSELLADWDPPKPFQLKFSLRNLLPDWGLGGFGWIISVVLIILMGFTVLRVLFPFFRYFK